MNRSACFLLSASLLLAACEFNALTSIDASGGGRLRSEVGFTPEERLSLEEQAGNAQDFCGVQRTSAGMTITEEQRGSQTWCIATASFASLDELRGVYGENEGISVNRLEQIDGRLYYDLNLDTTSPESSLSSFSALTWSVELPGVIVDDNADERLGSTVVWELAPRTGITNVRAESTLESLPSVTTAPPLLLILGFLIAGGAILYARLRRDR